MLTNNINYPIITISSNNGGKTSLNENIYKKDYTSSNLIELEKTRISLLGTSFTNNNYNQAQVYDKEIFDLYDNVGNILQSKTTDGVPETTIWGYKQNYPIAKIKGATYSQIVNAFGLDGSNLNSYLQLNIVKKSDLDINDFSENLLLEELNIFRNKEQFKDFEISTFTYDPQVGIKSITSSSGIKEIYKYDSANRLKEIRQDNSAGKILKEHKYNYAPRKFFSNAVNQTFTNNNCPTGTVSGSINYSVPEAKYVSIINQADADQQAINEAQNYANSNLTCYYPYCEFNAQSSSSYVMVQYAPFQKVNNVVNAELHFMVTSNQGLNWSGGVLLGYIPSPCWPTATFTKTSGNWQVTIYQGSGQTLLRWTGSGNPSTGTPYNITFNYNVN